MIPDHNRLDFLPYRSRSLSLVEQFLTAPILLLHSAHSRAEPAGTLPTLPERRRRGLDVAGLESAANQKRPFDLRARDDGSPSATHAGGWPVGDKANKGREDQDGTTEQVESMSLGGLGLNQRQTKGTVATPDWRESKSGGAA